METHLEDLNCNSDCSLELAPSSLSLSCLHFVRQRSYYVHTYFWPKHFKMSSHTLFGFCDASIPLQMPFFL